MKNLFCIYSYIYSVIICIVINKNFYDIYIPSIFDF